MEHLQKNIEKIFRECGKPDELFDAFQEAISKKIDNKELYKILLANPALTADELMMYTEKLASEYKNDCFDLFMWSGAIFENKAGEFTNINNALRYYKKAAVEKPADPKPYLSILKLYNYDINLPVNLDIIKEIDSGIKEANRKSVLYYALASHWERLGNFNLKKKYLGLAEKSALKENQ
jgi:hypothetical protein